MPLVYVHGGVSGARKEHPPSLAASFEEALRAATAVDSVELAVRALEDNPFLNAGWGSVLNRDGAIELDAGIADGASGRVGGVLGVTVRNPITLARLVMDKTPHVLLTSEGAMALGADMEKLEGSTDEQQARFEEARRSDRLDDQHYGVPDHVDTVGAIALDESAGHLAAGSSTGGVFGKMPGRVGDSPIFGAGTYASGGSAVVGTGVGELFLETLACARTGALIEEGRHPQEACERVIMWVGERSNVAAGLLGLDRSGRVGAAYRGGSWAVEGPDGSLSAVLLD
ncbi:MAG: isoaspartyl peptidase/L-asparaginase family protein [Actinomycetota bacterium]